MSSWRVRLPHAAFFHAEAPSGETHDESDETHDEAGGTAGILSICYFGKEWDANGDNYIVIIYNIQLTIV